jgi:kinase-associated protein B
VIVKSKTGEYIAKLMEFRNDKYAVVEVLAVTKHPTQGDLHFPNEVDVPLFHQRKAHAFREKVVVNNNALEPFEEEIPDYQHSLRTAVDQKLEALKEKGNEWAQKSIELIKDLEKEYFK